MMMDVEKQLVCRANRLMRVRKVRCLRSIFCVCGFPTAWVSKLSGRGDTPAGSVDNRERPNGRNTVCHCQQTSSSGVPHPDAQTIPFG
jgi:hypothetical protein